MKKILFVEFLFLSLFYQISFLTHSYRLPRNAKPKHYHLSIETNIERNIFNGTNIIKLKTHKKTENITLHSKGLNITSISLLSKLKESIKIKEFKFDPSAEQLIIFLQNELLPNIYYFKIKFIAHFNKELNGLYLSRYNETINNSTKTYTIATTQFEPVYARKVFPCFDEPNMKATFSIELIGEKDMTYLSNTEIIKNFTNNRGLKVTRFARTPKMSTYLVAFVISDFVSTDTIRVSDVDIKVYATREMIKYTNFAEQLVSQLIPFYENKFGIKYPLTKCDLVAIPDFTAGAMENWGLITFRESTILLKSENNSTNGKHEIALTIAHELAHQWFGNMVTMDWWNDLFLNEGFATWISYKAIDFIYPTWKIKNKFYYHVQSASQYLDSLPSSRSISKKNTKDTSNEITSFFDSNTYLKGASLIEMISTYINEISGNDNKFYENLSKYLQKYQYSNANIDQLWESLNTDEIKISAIMETWISSPNLPKLTLKIKSDGWYISQSKHILGNNGNFKSNEQNWWIICNYKINMDSNVRSINIVDQSEIKISGINNNTEWIKFNIGQSGFYLVSYPDRIIDNIKNLLKTDSKSMPEIDKAGFINDLFVLSFDINSRENITTALNFATYLKHEKELSPWVIALSNFNYIKNMIKDTKDSECYTHFKKYVLNIIDEIYKELDWIIDDSLDDSDKMLTSIIIKTAVVYENKEAINMAFNKYKHWELNNSELHEDLKYSVYLGAIKYNDDLVFESLLKKFKNTNLQSDRIKILYALSSSKNIENLKVLLRMVKNKEIRLANFTNLAYAMSINEIGKELLWNFISENWNSLNPNEFGAHIINSIASSINTREDITKIRDFFKNHNVGDGENQLNLLIEQTIEKINFKESNEYAMCRWFKESENIFNFNTPIDIIEK